MTGMIRSAVSDEAEVALDAPLLGSNTFFRFTEGIGMSEAAEITNVENASYVVRGKQMSLSDVQGIVRGAGTWFWWVAGLSLANSIAAMLELDYGMILGLGAGQFIDAIFLYDFNGTGEAPSLIARGLHLLISVGLAGVFFALGRSARQFSVKAFVVGLVLYALDSLLFVFIRDWVAVAVHVFVLFTLWGGFTALRAMRAQSTHVQQAVA